MPPTLPFRLAWPQAARLGSFRVPDGVDADGIEAHFDKGVLTVRLPKTAEAQQTEKKIAVKVK